MFALHVKCHFHDPLNLLIFEKFKFLIENFRSFKEMNLG